MGTPIVDPWVGGGGRADLGAGILGDGTGNNNFWIRNMGSDLLYSADSGGVPPQVGDMDHGTTPLLTIQRELALTISRRLNEVRGGGRTGEINLQD